jgi:hypothetical protein
MPWTDNLAWDDALARHPDIVIAGDRRGEFAYRRDQLICDEAVWESPRNSREEDVRSRLVDANADLVTNRQPDERQARKADVASELGLRLLDVPDGDIPRLVGDARDQRVALTYNHVVFANPQRHGGCAPPVLLEESSPIGVAENAGEGKRILVLDTGMPDPPPVDVEALAAEDVEPAGAGPGMGHGTMIAGVIARNAPGASIVVRRVLETPLGVADELDVAMALSRLPDDVDIVNASFGGRAAPRETMAVFKRAVNEVRPESLVIASAGNEGESHPHFMAAFKRVVGVASVTEVGQGVWQIEDYSNRGWWIDLSTAGTDVETVDREGRPVLCSGTSFAAALVSARVAAEASAGNLSVIDAARQLVAGVPVVPDAGTIV